MKLPKTPSTITPSNEPSTPPSEDVDWEVWDKRPKPEIVKARTWVQAMKKASELFGTPDVDARLLGDRGITAQVKL